MEDKKVCVIGLGYVGLPLALLASTRGYDVVGVDLDEIKVDKINKKEAPFKDEYLEHEISNSTMVATTQFNDIQDSDIAVICVPTPVSKNYQPNLEPVIQACKMIGEQMQKGLLVILESTVNPGVSEEVVLPVLENTSGLKAGVDFHLAHCPERINPGDTNWNISNIPRVVGSLTEEGLSRAVKFYRNVIDAEVKPMSSLQEAEAVKIVENSFRDVNIAFVNELAMSFSRLNIDLVKVIEGASSKPFAFMPHYPGCGVGGHCIPVDPYYLIEYARQKNGFHHDFLSLARKINNKMPDYTAEMLLNKLRDQGINVPGAKVAVLGLAYKPDLDDDRESPSYKIIESLQGYGLEVATYDPFIPKGTAKTLEEALTGAKAVIVATAHTEFRQLKPEDFLQYNIKIVIDGRNCLNKDELVPSGIIYQGVGR